MTLNIEKTRMRALPAKAASPGRPSIISGDDEINMIRALKSGKVHTLAVPRANKASYVQRIKALSIQHTGHKAAFRTAEADSPDMVKLIFQGMQTPADK